MERFYGAGKRMSAFPHNNSILSIVRLPGYFLSCFGYRKTGVVNEIDTVRSPVADGIENGRSEPFRGNIFKRMFVPSEIAPEILDRFENDLE